MIKHFATNLQISQESLCCSNVNQPTFDQPLTNPHIRRPWPCPRSESCFDQHKAINCWSWLWSCFDHHKAINCWSWLWMQGTLLYMIGLSNPLESSKEAIVKSITFEKFRVITTSNITIRGYLIAHVCLCFNTYWRVISFGHYGRLPLQHYTHNQLLTYSLVKNSHVGQILVD